MKKYIAKWNSIYADTKQMRSYTSYVEDWNRCINAFIEFDPHRSINREAEKSDKYAVSWLQNVPFAVKDNIAVKDFYLTCGSKMLEGLRSPYTATAVEKLQQAGGRVVGKTNLDESGRIRHGFIQ